MEKKVKKNTCIVAEFILLSLHNQKKPFFYLKEIYHESFKLYCNPRSSLRKRNARCSDAAVDITQQDTHEQQHQHDGDDGDTAQHVRRPAADSLRLVDLAQQERRILGFEIHDEAVNLRIHQFVAVAEAHPFVPRPVVDADAVAGHPILQRPEDDGDRILHGRRGERIDDPLTVGDHDARFLSSS